MVHEQQGVNTFIFNKPLSVPWLLAVSILPAAGTRLIDLRNKQKF